MAAASSGPASIRQANAGTFRAARRSCRMDLGKRQALQKALTAATDRGAQIVIRRGGFEIRILPDFVCFETYVEATAVDGQMLTLRYEEIEDVKTTA